VYVFFSLKRLTSICRIYYSMQPIYKRSYVLHCDQSAGASLGAAVELHSVLPKVRANFEVLQFLTVRKQKQCWRYAEN
jgi:hypothetical protein